MKLEKFDYEIGNKKTKNEFIALSILCVVLIITVVLYRTFASFTSSESYSIIGGRVAPFNDSRRALVTKDISLTSNDRVNAILYNDGSLTISGSGDMKNFEGKDLIAEVFDDYIASQDLFSEEERQFIEENVAMMNALFDIVSRPWSFEVTENKMDEFLTAKYTTEVENEEPVVDEESINKVKAILDKVAETDFYIEKVEITGDVTSIGTNAFALLAATNQSESRDSSVYESFYTGTDYAGNPNMPINLNVFNLEASITENRTHALSDINATSIVIGNNVTIIPNDMFAWYVGSGDNLELPNSITSIGIEAFYSFDGASLVLPEALQKIDERAFASYDGNNVTIPNTCEVYKIDAFKSFTKTLTINVCPSEELTNFAPKATINSTAENCS